MEGIIENYKTRVCLLKSWQNTSPPTFQAWLKPVIKAKDFPWIIHIAKRLSATTFPGLLAVNWRMEKSNSASVAKASHLFPVSIRSSPAAGSSECSAWLKFALNNRCQGYLENYLLIILHYPCWFMSKEQLTHLRTGPFATLLWRAV